MPHLYDRVANIPKRGEETEMSRGKERALVSGTLRKALGPS